MKPIKHIFNATVIVFCILVCSLVNASEPRKGWCVVIDAGHGGKDPGTVFEKYQEKSINLAIAQGLGRELEKRVAGIKIVYTRSDDRFVELAGRSAIANKASGDLFVSIHVNSNERSSPRGTETYVMGLGKSNANLSVTMRENGVVSLEDDYRTVYEGYDPKSSESLIMFSLMQYSYQTQSLELARAVEVAYVSSGLGLPSRGVKQDGFLVLWRTSMPCILTEVGFLSNAEDRKLLTSTAGQKKIVASLASAVELYIGQNPKHGALRLGAPVAVAPKVTPEPKPVAVDLQGVYYSVQIRSSSLQLSLNSSNFGPLVLRVWERKVKNVHKYYVDRVISYKEALTLQIKLREIYNDAFVVAFSGDEPIGVDQAKKITEKR